MTFPIHPTARAARGHGVARAALLAAAVLFTLLARAPHARADEAAVLRVTAEQALIHTGPGFGHRIVHRAMRGEILRAVSRATREHWFQVELPDGTYGWVLGDAVLPLEVDPTAGPEIRRPSMWKQMSDAMFSPAPLSNGHVGLSFSAGVLGGEGLFLFRPAFLVEPHIAIEGFIGESIGDQVDVLYYGGGANAFLFPRSPVTPFLALGGGGARGRKKADQFTIRAGHFKMAAAGGGLLIALKKRITLRADARHYVIFDANHTHQAQEYSGGLAVVF